MSALRDDTLPAPRRSPLHVYDEGLLTRTAAIDLRFANGTLIPLAIDRYTGAADATDEQLLSDLSGPVLDVGCGPGRHLHALARRGVFALGVDLSPVAVRLACGGGARAIVASIFDELPGAGSWRSALLLDGNVGIGGDPARLLARVRELLAPAGVAVCELDPPDTISVSIAARLETAGVPSAWFAWARVAAPDIDALAAACGYRRTRAWSTGGRWFATLERD